MTQQKNIEEIKQNLGTKQEITWCPGCHNFLIFESVKKAIAKVISDRYKQEQFAIATGIGCHQKIYDYLNLSGIYGLHGRVLPLCLGMKLGNPNLKVMGFAGDGDAYADGMEHFIHTGRFNPDMVYIVADNRNFSLTTGQSTPTSPEGFISKAEPLGEFHHPLNPIKLALVSGVSFVARCNAKDIAHTSEVIEKAIKHKGFAYVEILMDCLIFNPNVVKDKEFYKIDNSNDMKKALEFADEWDYDNQSKKIPIGIFYKHEKPILEEKWPQLKKLMDKKVGWN